MGLHNRAVVAPEAPSDRPKGLRTARLEAYSDGVFAIASTLLILDIAVPAGSNEDLLRAVGDQWPSYLAYIVSFSTIGVVWLAHSAITEYLDRADSVLIRLNLLLLLVVAFLPFPTHLVAEYVGTDRAERVAVTIYGLNLLIAAGLVSVLWRYSVREHLVRPDAKDEEVQLLTKRLTPGLLGYVLAIVLGLFLPIVAVWVYLIIAVYIIVPVGSIVRRSRGARKAGPTR
jgi:uncharacterized membrane protein